MKKLIPLYLAIISLVFFLGIIFKNERHLKHSQSIYVRLQPVDPRSIIQGDYMALNYQLYFLRQNNQFPMENQSNSSKNHIQPDKTSRHVFSRSYYDERINNRASILTYVELDQKRRVVHTFLDAPKNIATAKLILKNPDNRYESLYPASRSFLFAEGLASCYQDARYAEFKVDRQGNAILNALKGEQLQDLNCENTLHWKDGFRATHESL